MSFTKETPILYFNPRSSNRWSKRQYLLLPAWCYRVIAPKIQQRKVNILEKAVLGICRIGAFSAVEIGENLDISTDLASLIMIQLTDRGLIDKQGLINERGLKILEQETIDEQNMVAGFIFQDPWTVELFPRFIEHQEYIDVQFNSDGYPEINLGTTGKPDYRRIYMPFPLDKHAIMQVQPSTQDILQAISKHGKASRYHQAYEDLDDDDWSFKQVPNLKRISFIEAEPTPVWLATFIYAPEDSYNTTIWNICDPFGLGDSPWLRRKLESQIKKNPSFQWMNKLLSQLIDIPENSQETVNSPHDFLQMAEEDAMLKVETKLTRKIHSWKNIFDSLVLMEISYIEAEFLDKPSRKKDKLDDVIIKAQKAIETVLLSIREAHPTDSSWQVLSGTDREYNRNLFNGLAMKLGFTTPLPYTLVDVKLGKIRASADSGTGSLRSHLLAALLTIRYNNQHPLYLLAQKSPDILTHLDKLAEIRDRSSHSSNQQLESSTVLQQISTVYDFISGILEIDYQP